MHRIALEFDFALVGVGGRHDEERVCTQLMQGWELYTGIEVGTPQVVDRAGRHCSMTSVAQTGRRENVTARYSRVTAVCGQAPVLGEEHRWSTLE